jgi:esterase/lipase
MRRLALLVLLLTAAVAGCGGSSAPVARSSSPAAPAPAARAVSFTATDGVGLTGRSYGAGTTGVVLSNMGDNDPSRWEAFAPKLAARGYLVLTYSYRYPPGTSSFTSDMARHTVDDLRGAVAHLRSAGTTSVVLAGGSLGGMATAKVAAVEKATAMVVLAAPVDLDDYGFHVLPAELQADLPKLFVASKQDSVVPIAQTERMFSLAGQPKELKTYDGSEHALHLFDGEHADELEETLIAFVEAKAPPRD